MTMDILVFMIGSVLILVLGFGGMAIKGSGGNSVALIALFGAVFGMIFTGAAISAATTNNLTLGGTPLSGANYLSVFPLFATIVDIVILVEKLR